jgi:hypothetical protein
MGMENDIMGMEISEKELDRRRWLVQKGIGAKGKKGVDVWEMGLLGRGED